VPLPFAQHTDFLHFWLSLPPAERMRWDSFSPVLADRFQPLVYVADDRDGIVRAHTGLLALTKTG
jgi:hypothetical protein